MKKSVLFACLVSLILFFNGCGGARPAVQEGPAQKKKITFLNYFSNTLSYGNAQLIKSFNDHSSEYELEATTLDHEAFKTSIYETLKAGNPPDIYSNWAGARVRAVLEHLEPIDDIWKEGNLDKSFNRSLIDTACTYDGRKYLIPISQHFIAFFYNKKIFDDLKLTPPANWNDFLKVCDAIKKAGVTPIALGSKTKWPAQFWFDYLLLRTAPYEYREKLLKGEAGYKDRESLAAFKLWSDLVLKGYFNANPNDTDWESGANEMVFKGEAAMTLMGAWITGSYSDDKHKWTQGKDYDFFPFPIVDEKIPKVILGGLDGLVIPKKAVNVSGAKKALLYLAGAESQKSMSRGWGTLAPNINIEKDFYTDMQRRLLAEAASCPKLAFHYDLTTPPAAAALGLAMFTRILEFPADYEVIIEKAAPDFIKAFNK